MYQVICYTFCTGVACRQLGYSTGAVIPIEDFGVGSDPIWMVDLRCGGTERQLAECNHAGWGNIYTCVHGRDVAIQCEERGQFSFRIMQMLQYECFRNKWQILWGSNYSLPICKFESDQVLIYYSS